MHCKFGHYILTSHACCQFGHPAVGSEPVEPMNHKIKCTCGCCGEKPKTWFSVKPFEWHMGNHGRQGTSYQIIEHSMIATSKCRLNADRIVAALNGDKMKEEIISAQKAKIEVLEGNTLRYLPPELVREAIVDEIRELKHYCWSSHRQYIINFTIKVLKRLAINHHLD